jgi:hypothetical protein
MWIFCCLYCVSLQHSFCYILRFYLLSKCKVIGHVQLLLLLCIILILECIPGISTHNQHLHSEFIYIIHHKICTWFRLSVLPSANSFRDYWSHISPSMSMIVCNRPLAPILRQRWCSLVYDVYCLARWLLFKGSKYLEHILELNIYWTIQILNDKIEQRITEQIALN